jgi:hypothetical protein
VPCVDIFKGSQEETRAVILCRRICLVISFTLFTSNRSYNLGLLAANSVTNSTPRRSTSGSEQLSAVNILSREKEHNMAAFCYSVTRRCINGVEVKFHAFLISVLQGTKWLFSYSSLYLGPGVVMGGAVTRKLVRYLTGVTSLVVLFCACSCLIFGASIWLSVDKHISN